MCKNQTLINRIRKTTGIKLNAAQAAAVAELEGVSCVQSGPGCGKSSVLLSKAVNIVFKYPEAHIVALSFTKKSVNELQARFAKLNINNVQVSTIHSFLLRIMKTFDAQYRYFRFIENTAERASICNEAIRRCGLTEKYTVEDVCKLLAKGNFQDKADNELVDEYLQILKENHLLCFDSIIYLAIELLKLMPSAAYHVRNSIDYLLVDEFQDMTLPEIQAIEMIFNSNTSNLTFCYDMHQSIFSFRGAYGSKGIENIINFYNPKVFTLTQNYRCRPETLELANTILPVAPMLKATKETKADCVPIFFAGDTARDEALFVVSEIKKLHAAGVKYKDIAIISRIGKAAGTVFDELIKADIPIVKLNSDVGRYSNSRFKCLLALLSSLYDPAHASLYWKCSLPIIGAPSSIMNYINNAEHDENNTIQELILSIPSLSRNQKQRFQNFFSIDVENLSFFQVVEKLWDEYLKPWFRVQDNYIYEEFLETLGSVRSYAELCDEVMKYRRNIHKMNAILHSGKDFCSLYSAHSVKGLEFPYVFIVQAAEGVLPCAKEGTDIDEENRLAYVASTRSQEKLYVSFAKVVNGTAQKPSRFFASYFENLK